LLDSVNYLAISKVSYNLNNSINYFKSFDPSLNIKIFSSYIANLNVMNINVNMENDIIRYILNYGIKNCTRMVNYAIQNLDPIYLDPIYCYDIDRTVLALPIEVKITTNMIRFEFDSILRKVFDEISMSDDELITYSKANKKTYWLNYSNRHVNLRAISTLNFIKSFVFSANLKLLTSINLNSEGSTKIEFGISPISSTNYSLTPENRCNLNRWTINAKGYKNNFAFSSRVSIEGANFKYNTEFIEDYVNSVLMNMEIFCGQYYTRSYDYRKDIQFLRNWELLNDNVKLDSSLSYLIKNNSIKYLYPQYEGLYYFPPEPQKSIILKMNFVTTLEEVENQLRFKLKIRE